MFEIRNKCEYSNDQMTGTKFRFKHFNFENLKIVSNIRASCFELNPKYDKFHQI